MNARGPPDLFCSPQNNLLCLCPNTKFSWKYYYTSISSCDITNGAPRFSSTRSLHINLIMSWVLCIILFCGEKVKRSEVSSSPPSASRTFCQHSNWSFSLAELLSFQTVAMSCTHSYVTQSGPAAATPVGCLLRHWMFTVGVLMPVFH